ncbi:MAG: lysine--tRNA ligase [Caldiserica bacterium CG02_land_8_20_14_3_00_36_38]|jgi:lysyl-tRNA synthetase class 2|nr:lysine--tRNA ligase [Caldisericota bacterium]OIP14121.1 MAG: lysine--tRNA ligase [Caldisericum sp. CG2_30_36_11]PIP49994.1 MAG: lysine--tRNA ligase [Caldiserica bacterium CG23_combo_of_CG06-09_8_20_14_all_35_60]PIV55740.1 MAG: lysine--tRNA ligase [Caldiserica bacterium CG02_land_8_20_14_3_00_36_38]PIW10447.1 MAG: lysine--tRNA ligase [Caldiserica bacterium CG17_big_fil_post_rev_8_21_14_2_50_35_7]PIX29854.1 MAG: lysine--tRNA ligase [Caldiserica bacterium CG_4_8_14_3_um_filter_35_18]
MNEESLNEIEKVRKELVLYLKSAGIDPFGKRFITELSNKAIKENFENLTEKTISAKGRIIAIRGHGKAAFVTVRDFSGDLQFYFRLDNLGEEKYTFFKKVIDIGDFIGATGALFKTHTGEITLEVKDFLLLTKAIKTLPEKWHGLKDPELRYRKRYLDLISNRETLELFVKRSKIVNEIRNFLLQKEFIEVETPMFQAIPGGASAKPFITHYNALDQDMYLRIAPELYLKRLIIGGFEKVFEINRNFRNEGISTKHNPEFTMLEAYWAYADYNDVMKLTEDLIYYVANTVLQNPVVEYKEQKIDFTPPFKRIQFNDVLKEYAGVTISDIRNSDDLRGLLSSLGIKMEKPLTIGNVINEIFDKKVEINFIQPTFVYDFPLEISPLAKRTENDPHMVYRFEIFIGGLEIANAFSELNDPIDQYERFKGQMEAKNKGEEETQEMDMDYIEAMEYGLPPTGGLGIGIDRLVMLLTGKDSIREVMLFPQLKKKEEDEEK